MNQATTQQTIDMMKQQATNLAKDAVTQGYIVGTGITGYNLEAPAKSLFPVLSPFRNSIPRKKAPKGAPAANWKAITGINVSNKRATTAFGAAGNQIETSTADYMAPYKVISLGDTVQYDAEKQAQGYQDLRATAGVNLLYALMEQEDIVLVGGQNFSLGTPAQPALTVTNAGGSIGAVNVAVAVAVRTMQGWFDGQNSIASTPATTGVLAGTNNVLTSTVAWVPGAVVYDWYVGVAGGTLWYYGSSTSPKMTITSVPTQAQAVNMADETLSMLGAPPNTAPVVDNTPDPNSTNGLIATLIGNYNNGTFVQNGMGNPSGAYYKNLNGQSFTATQGTIDQIDEGLQYLWANAKLSPTRIRVNAIDHVNISNKIIASGGSYVAFRPSDVGERQSVVGGQLVMTYLNKFVNGRQIPIETHPWLPQGTILIETTVLPYPNNEVANVMEVETLQEYEQLEYAASRQPGANGGPRFDFEVRAQEVFKNYFPGSMAIIQGVSPN